MMKESKADITILKIGGSLVTEKKKPYTLDSESVFRIAKEIDDYLESKSETERLVVVHGGGSYSHTIASAYKTKLESLSKLEYGFILISWAARELNGRIIKIFLDYGIRAFPLQPSAIISKKGGTLMLSQIDLIRKVIEMDWVPILYGDIILDVSTGGCEIISGERVIQVLASSFPLRRIVALTDVEGVLRDVKDPSSIILKINETNFRESRKWLGGSSSRDVTGGMEHKVQILLEIAKERDVKSLIANGRKPGNLLSILKGESVGGTEIG